MNKTTTTLEELGFNFDDNQHCEDCPTGHCHDRAIGNLYGQKVPMYIHVSVHAPDNIEPCAECEFKVTVKVNNVDDDDPRNRDYEFDTESETVNFLVSTFDKIECTDW